MLMLPAVDWGVALVAPPPSSPTIDQSFWRTCKRPVMVSPLARTERIQTPDWQGCQSKHVAWHVTPVPLETLGSPFACR